MQIGRATELVLVRHAPALTGGRLCGRTDVAADCTDAAGLSALRDRLGDPGRLIASPALRCRQTAAALWPDLVPETMPELLEQDFGDWEGTAPAALPDLGDLDRAALATHRPPGGESFADLCARTGPALLALAAGGRVTVIAHAGTVRAALALALGDVPAALAFEVAPLSLSRITGTPGGAWTIGTVNQVAA